MEVFIPCRLADKISDCKDYVCVHICAYACTVKIHWFIAQKTAFYPIVEYSG